MSATTTEDTTSPPPTSVWMHRFRTGCLLVAVSLLLSPILVDALAFIFPFLGLRRADLIWLRFLYVPSGILLIFGIFALTTVVAERDVRARRTAWGKALCALVVVEGTCRLYSTAIVAGGWRVPIDVLAMSLLVRTVLFPSMMFLVSGICDRFEAHRIARSFRIIAGLILCWTVVDLTKHAWSSTAGPTGSILVLLVLSEKVILVWAAMRLLQMRKLLPEMIAGRCLSCGYPLEGLTEPRCPECGCSFRLCATAL